MSSLHQARIDYLGQKEKLSSCQVDEARHLCVPLQYLMMTKRRDAVARSPPALLLLVDIVQVYLLSPPDHRRCPRQKLSITLFEAQFCLEYCFARKLVETRTSKLRDWSC